MSGNRLEFNGTAEAAAFIVRIANMAAHYRGDEPNQAEFVPIIKGILDQCVAYGRAIEKAERDSKEPVT